VLYYMEVLNSFWDTLFWCETIEKLYSLTCGCPVSSKPFSNVIKL
jgi:hypothetical protein